MAKSLEGRVAIVTGVSHAGQVGTTVAKALAAEGAALAICARTQSNVDARAGELRQSGARVLSLAVSLTDEVQVRRLISDVVNEFQRIDILINLAGGLTRYKPAVEHGLDDWHAEIDNNLLSAFLASREVFPHMAKAGGGSIINFSRAGGPQANMVAYNCAKAGVEALTRTLALEGRDIGIRVNAIAPGLVDTESNIAAMKPKDLKHWTKRDDIASSVVFLASPAAAGVTGQVLPVTGWGL
jgi:NAD(P)-dependent dehydrogenase (short-subunit alcohol dehydrogenase family)